MSERIVRFVKETSMLRKEIAQADDFGDPIVLELTGRELAAVTYALALSYINEWVCADNGHKKIMAMISEASATILTVASREDLDEVLREILGEGEVDAA